MTASTPPAVRQLRLVVQVDDIDAALRFYRDALGLTERAAFEGDGDARVAILEAGVATLELANPAQVRMIDGLETDGDTSDLLRVAFEVDDPAAATAALAAAGAELVASPRETPWRSLNSRLRSPDGLQLTLFEELGAAPEDDALYEFEGWRLDPLKRRLADPDGATVPISTAEFRLLTAFLDRPKQVIDRDRLLDLVQGREAHLFDRAVDNQISRLRRKIEEDTRNPHFIQTVRGGGYRFAADVRRIAAQ